MGTSREDVTPKAISLHHPVLHGKPKDRMLAGLWIIQSVIEWVFQTFSAAEHLDSNGPALVGMVALADDLVHHSKRAKLAECSDQFRVREFFGGRLSGSLHHTATIKHCCRLKKMVIQFWRVILVW
jgi:hypothetical protein